MAKTTIEFNDNASDELARLANVLSTTKADVLRSALSLYAFVVGELHDRGGQLKIGGDQEPEKIIVVPGLQTMQSVKQARGASAHTR